MAETNQLNYGWLDDLSNPHHDGTTQQIDDFVQAFVSDNAIFNQKRAAVHQARLVEDEVWFKSQRDPVVPRLEAADKQQDGYVACAHYIIMGHAGLPDGEPTKAEAKVCAQVFKDFKFRTTDAYGAESDKIIQMQQNLQAHEAFLTSIGAWTFYTKAVTAAQLVRQLLGERALTMGGFVKGEMKNARRQTDLAIAELYRTIMAMMELMPSAELTALCTQLKGIELYAKQYYISSGSSSAPNGDQGGSTPSDDSGTTEPGGEGGEQGGGEQDGGEQGGGDQGGGDQGGDDNGGGDNGGGEHGGGSGVPIDDPDAD